MIDFNEDSYQSKPIDASGNTINPDNKSDLTNIMGASFRQGFQSFDPSPYINNKLFQLFDKSQQVPHDELPAGIKENVSRDTPITRNQLNYMMRVRKADDYDQQTLNYMSDNLLSKSASFVSGLAGNVLSPGALGVAGLSLAASPVAAAIGVADMAIPSAITRGISAIGGTNTYTRIGMNIAKASIGGAIAMGAMTPFQYVRQRALAEPASYYDDLIDNVKQGFYTGASIYLGGKALQKTFKGLVGTYKKWSIGDAQENANTFQTAQNQVLVDKEINTNVIRDNTLNRTKSQISDDDVKSMQSDNINYQKNIDTIDEALNKIKKPTLEHHSTASNIAESMRILRKSAMDRTETESKFVSDLQDHQHYRDLIEAQTTLPIDRTPEQVDLLDSLSSLKNENDTLKQHRDEILNLKKDAVMDDEKLSNMNARDKEKYNIAHESIDQSLNKIKSRLDELKTISSNDLLKKHLQYHQLLLEKDGLQNMIDHNNAALNIYNEAEPLTNKRLRQDNQSYKGVETNGTFVPALEDHYETDYKNAKPIEESPTLESINEEFQDLSPEDRLESDNELALHQNTLREFPKLMKNMINCIIGETT